RTTAPGCGSSAPSSLRSSPPCRVRAATASTRTGRGRFRDENSPDYPGLLMKVGIVVPYSWSFWGAVLEHAELQADALTRLGIETRSIMGHDPPGTFTSVLHPRHGRHGRPPPDVLPVGRSVIVPANGSLPNIVLSPSSVIRIKRILERERFDVLNLHGPMPPPICPAVLALARCPIVATFHASGDLGWMRAAKPTWGFLAERIDHRIAVSEHAATSAQRWLGGEYEIVPNGVLVPPEVDPGGREHRILFAGRQEPRKGLHVMTTDTGVLVPPGAPVALADAVVGLVEDEDRRRSLGASARALAIARYSWDDIGRRLAGIYELVAGRAPAGVAAP